MDKRIRKLETTEMGRGELAIAQFEALCGLRGLWPMGAVGSSGLVRDFGGGDFDLLRNGSTMHGTDGQAPYIYMDGAGDYLNTADNANWDIICTEAYIVAAQRGLTIGAWVNLETVGADRALISKWTAATNNRAYFLYYSNANTAFEFAVSSNGAAAVTVTDAVHVTPTLDSWYFVVGRFTPSSELMISVNAARTTVVAGVPAFLFNSNASLLVGASGGGGLSNMKGKLSYAFVCASAISDATTSFLFQQTRAMYGV